MSLLRDAARRTIRLLVGRFYFTVLSGINRGRHWRVEAGTLKCWFGTYEPDEAALIAALVKPGATVFDVGAHAGYYTLAASRLVGEKGRVVAFEPDPVNVEYLRDHAVRNRVRNVTIIPRPVGNKHGLAARFVPNPDHRYESGLSEDPPAGDGDGGERMRLVSLDRLIADGLPVPDLVKMDIEGGESAAVEGASALVAGLRTAWLISTHGAENVIRLVPLFQKAGYAVHDVKDGRCILGEPELPIYSILALPPGRSYPASALL
jgi:FkbM family methyltransferase